MASFSNAAFSTNAFAVTAWDFGAPSPSPAPAPSPSPQSIVYGGGGYFDGYWEKAKSALRQRIQAEDKLAENKRLIELKRLELERKEAELERKRQLDIQAKWLVNEIEAINSELLLIEQQNILMRAMLTFWMQEEEDCYIILMTTI